jgi:hypothetical protein
MTGQGKQAKILSEAQIRGALGCVQQTRYPLRDRVMILLSVKAGLRAKEIACLTWAMVTDAEGAVGDAIHLENRASKDAAAVAPSRSMSTFARRWRRSRRRAGRRRRRTAA